MIKLLHNNIKSEFISIIENTKKEILIISPFIGYQTAKLICSIKNSGIKIVLITRFSRKDFYNGVSSIKGLKLMIDSGIEILAVKRLHTKLYVFDKSSVILGSSNFTEGGLSANIELNVFITDEFDLVNAAVNYFNECYVSINKVNYITSEIIDNEIKIIESLEKTKERIFSENTILGENLQTKKIFDDLEVSLQDTEIENTSTAWLKFEGFSDSNRDSPDNEINLILEDGKYKTYFSRKPTGMKTGDIVFIARHSIDKEGNFTPFIYGYGFVRSFTEENISSIEEQNIKKNRKEYPFFINVEKFIFSKNKIGDCLSLKYIFGEIGGELFPKTNRNIGYQEFQHKYSQRSHMRISFNAKSYLLNEIQKII